MHIKKHLHIIAYIFVAITVFACSNEEDVPDVSAIQVDVSFRRLEKELFALKTKGDIRQYLTENPDLAEGYFKKSRYPSEDILVNYIFELLTHSYSDTLYRQVIECFNNIEDLRRAFVQAFKFAKYYFPNFKIPKIYTSISAFGAYGFGGDFVLSDEYIVIGLDYFTGRRASLRPKMPKYMLDRYEREYIVPSTLMLISSRYNAYNELDKSLLSEMIFYGKALYFVSTLMPYAPDSLIAGYSDQEIADLERNQGLIWGHFIDGNLFYETNYMKKNRYVGERPKTYEISRSCPGRVGRWLGWKIVRYYSYYHPNKKLPQIMTLKDANKLFQSSKYKPPL